MVKLWALLFARVFNLLQLTPVKILCILVHGKGNWLENLILYPKIIWTKFPPLLAKLKGYLIGLKSLYLTAQEFSNGWSQGFAAISVIREGCKTWSLQLNFPSFPMRINYFTQIPVPKRIGKKISCNLKTHLQPLMLYMCQL